MPTSKAPDRVLPDRPETRPLERFWPYTDVREQPSDEELAKVDPDLRDALFGPLNLPFSVSLIFPDFALRPGTTANGRESDCRFLFSAFPAAPDFCFLLSKFLLVAARHLPLPTEIIC